jgi:hypothetical protein
MTGGCAGVAVRQAGDHIHIAIHMAIHMAAVLVWVDNAAGCTCAMTTTEPGTCRDAEGRLGLTPTPAVGVRAGWSGLRAAVAAARTVDGAERAV